MPSPKVIIDTNVLVSGFIFQGQSAKVIEFCIEYADNYSSEWLLLELKRVLADKFKLQPADVDRIVGLLKNAAGFFIIQPHTVLPDICRDPDDNNVLQLAESVGADYIITGDKDLLTMEKFHSAKIVSPTQFLEEMGLK